MLKLWRMRNLAIKGKITIFATLAISKIVHVALVADVLIGIINRLNKIQKEFICSCSNPKIKQTTRCKNYKSGGLKYIDILFKIISLQCSWIKRFYDTSTHSWKVIPSYLISSYLGKKLKFHSNLGTGIKNFFPIYYGQKRCPIYYKQIFKRQLKFIFNSWNSFDYCVQVNRYNK